MVPFSSVNVLSTGSLLDYQKQTYFTSALDIARSIGYPYCEEVALINLGTVSRDLGEREQAVQYLQDALSVGGDEKGSSRLVAMQNLAGVFIELGRSKDAIRQYQEAIAVFSDNYPAYRQVLNLFLEQPFLTSDDLLVCQGLALLGLGDEDSAIVILEKTFAGDPSLHIDPSIWYGLLVQTPCPPPKLLKIESLVKKYIAKG